MNADMDRDVIGRLLLLGAYLRSLRVHLWFHFPLRVRPESLSGIAKLSQHEAD
jgi:hypothetical protein